MPITLNVDFASLDAGLSGTVILLAAKGLKLGKLGAAIDARLDGHIKRAAALAGFTGQNKRHIELLAPTAMADTRLVIAGIGSPDNLAGNIAVNTGGRLCALAAAAKSQVATIVVDAAVSDPGVAAAGIAADIAMGALLRHYRFDRYKTDLGAADADGEAEEGGKNGARELESITILTADPDAARAAYVARRAVAEGVAMARDLVNEPANALGPVEFAAACENLRDLGVDVEILDVPALEDLGMRTLLAVAQGSDRPARVAVMQWHGAKSKRSKPLCFVGKGVVFDTGGISMKPAAGMEDMKGDMGGAAAVTGLMAALAGRQAAVNVVGIVGLVENMPSAKAIRPGDIVKSMSGKTVEILNTDAEGRLVLCDLLWYANERFKPRFMINLATLTGAIIVALGKEHAGLFSNDDRLSSDLAEVGEAVGETVWRMPLGAAYDKMLDTPNADMKNIGGRLAGSITAAQFLQRFVGDTPWAHLDVAGVAMASGKTDISRSWASGWGVRLLDELVAAKYEK